MTRIPFFLCVFGGRIKNKLPLKKNKTQKKKNLEHWIWRVEVAVSSQFVEMRNSLPISNV